MKYYIDKQFYDNYSDTWYSLEGGIDTYYDNFKDAQDECDYLNKYCCYKDNEKYFVCELEEE